MHQILLRFSLITCLFVLSLNILFGQTLMPISDHHEWFPAQQPKSPLFVYLASADYGRQLIPLIDRPDSRINHLIVRTDQVDAASFYKLTNAYLNAPEGIDLQRVYLILVGDSTEQVGYALADTEIFAATGRIDSVSTGLASQLTNLRSKLYQKKKWPVEVDRIKKRSLVITGRKGPEKFLSLKRSWWWLDFAGNDPPARDRHGSWALTYGWGIGKRLLLRTDLNIGVNSPVSRNNLREQVFGQVDINALLDGQSVEVQITTEIDGAVSAEFAVGGDYYLLEQRKFRPYVGLSLAAGFLSVIEGVIDTTVIIERGDFGVGFDRGSADVEPNRYPALFYKPRLGFKYILGKRLSVVGELEYTYDPAFGRGAGSVKSRRLVVGVRYRFLRRSSAVYQYLR